METTDLIVQILVACLALGIIGHMLYILFFKGKLTTTYTVDEFREKRIAEGRDEDSSESENQEAAGLLNEIFISWPVVGQSEEGDLRAPLKQKQITAAVEMLQTVIQLAPTDEDVVKDLNETARVINEANKREFNGSKRFIVIALLIGALISYISEGGWSLFWLLLVSSIIYTISSMTPAFILHRRMLKGNEGKSSFMSGLLAGVFGSVATATTYKTVTKWSDGSTTTETDNSETWIMLVIALFVCMVVSIFMWAIAGINYLRNYVLYI